MRQLIFDTRNFIAVIDKLEFKLAAIGLRQVLFDLRIAKVLVHLVKLDTQMTLLFHQTMIFRQIILRFHLVKLRDVLLIISRLARLKFDASQLLFDLGNDIAKTQQVLLDVFQTSLSFFSSGFIFADTRRFFKHRPAFLVRRLQEQIDLALFDQAIGIDTAARIHEQLANILQSRWFVVHQIIALAAAIKPTGNHHLGPVLFAEFTLRFERQRHFRHAAALSPARSVKNHVEHLSASQTFGGLLAKHPLERIDHVALAAAVRPDNRRDPRVKIQFRPVSKTLKTVQG